MGGATVRMQGGLHTRLMAEGTIVVWVGGDEGGLEKQMGDGECRGGDSGFRLAAVVEERRQIVFWRSGAAGMEGMEWLRENEGTGKLRNWGSAMETVMCSGR
ncbi:unnamed protein product [Calypogeia fissa]